MLHRIIRSILLAALGTALAIPTAPVAAGTIAGNMTQVSAEVRFGDLDLTSEAGVAQLLRRIRRTARALCGTPDIRDLTAGEAATACRTTVQADGASKVERAAADARTGRNFAANAALEVGRPGNR